MASNGIGKTSLIMAAAWGIFGNVAGVQGANEIRGEAEVATVKVELRLPSGDALVITRSVDQRGRETIEAIAGDRAIASQEEIDRVLSSEFGADARVLAQLTIMIHGGLHETQGEFTLQDHLAGLFGVRPLFEAATHAEALAAETASALRKTKIVERKDQRDKEELLADRAGRRAGPAHGRAAPEEKRSPGSTSPPRRSAARWSGRPIGPPLTSAARSWARTRRRPARSSAATSSPKASSTR